ncbi:hypothetical protein BGW37DRAFT_506785 [Umbelopsis sp. PMI_123]|nr:hypothetical protein BGW37DRAFT_506785 [Umbelopsis sp. PMI_123]
MSTVSSKRSKIPSRVEALEAASSAGSRQRQNKRDEAIRKKLEQELSKKRGGSARVRQSGKKIAGTVSALRPAQALTVKENMLVIEAAQLMAAKRSDCVLVVDEDEHLSGIFTAKDLAYRVVANSLDSRETTVSDIMTKGPMCVTADTSATDALNLMVSRGFRHLPVCNEEGDIFGLLDITKCLYEALDKMERAYGSSKKLYDALQGVEREWTNGGPVQIVQHMEMLREKMSCPDIASVLDGQPPVEVKLKANVKEIAQLMKAHHTTAVLVMDKHSLAGIFTSKDVVLRVIAAGLNPEQTSVVRVMTPHPDTATPDTTILEALRKMHDGHYLNLPIREENQPIIGVVDVLKLTYATLEQINSIQGADNEGGPMWNKFWSSFGADSDSAVSDPQTAGGRSHGLPESSLSPLQAFPEITPNESASMVNNEEARSTLSSQYGSQNDNTFAFKFSFNGKTHRFTAPHNSYDVLHDMILQKLDDDHDLPKQLAISFEDDEKDKVLITSDADLRDAVQLARKQGHDRVRLYVREKDSKSINVPKYDNSDSERAGSTSRKHNRDAGKKGQTDLILPAAIVGLGIAIIAAFAVTRLNQRQ